MNRDRYLSAVCSWMIRQISGWIMKNFARSLKKEWNPADIFSQEGYDAYPLKVVANGCPKEDTQKQRWIPLVLHANEKIYHFRKLVWTFVLEIL